MNINNCLITEAGYDKLKQELLILKNEKRTEILEAIEKAREHGDLSENAEYHSAREQQRLIEGKIRNLEDKLKNCQIVQAKEMQGDSIKFGATVKLQNLSSNQVLTYTILGVYEADTKHNTVSIASPIAKSMLGKKAEQIAEVVLPNGQKNLYKILDVQFPPQVQKA